jgi:hypothetical protein
MMMRVVVCMWEVFVERQDREGGREEGNILTE